MNCPNCGAVVKGDTCEYCGTVFHTPKEELNVTIEMKGDAEQIFRAVQQHIYSYRDADGRLHRGVFT